MIHGREFRPLQLPAPLSAAREAKRVKGIHKFPANVSPLEPLKTNGFISFSGGINMKC